METFDVAIVGGGPAGSSCAAFCALAGLRTLVIEREKFPREKVCGDCLNPSCWAVLEHLGVAQRVRDLPHSKLDSVEFIAIDGHNVVVDLPTGHNCEVSVKRSLFDDLLLTHARDVGADVREGTTVTALANSNGEGICSHGPVARPDLDAPQGRGYSCAWNIETDGGETFVARILIGADGRNSTVARLRNLLPRPARERVALQAHIPLPRNFGRRIILQFLPEGYSGQAPVNEMQLNLCLVGTPPTWARLQQFPDCANGRNAILKSLPINLGARSRRLPGRPFLAHAKIFSSSATPPAWWSHLPVKEFTTPSARGNWQQTRSRKSFGAKIDNQLCANSLALAPKCIGEDCGSTGWRALRYCGHTWDHSSFTPLAFNRRS